MSKRTNPNTSMVKFGLNHLNNGRSNIFKCLGFCDLGETRSFFDSGSPSSILLLLLRFFVDPSSIPLFLLRFFWFFHLWRFDFVMIFFTSSTFYLWFHWFVLWVFIISYLFNGFVFCVRYSIGSVKAKRDCWCWVSVLSDFGDSC